MNDINKQKFLAELAKLLTFMYEEDRQLALGAYTAMFDDAEDEQALLQALVSPLRQAVEVARAYNAGKPSLKDGQTAESEEENHFLDTIDRIRDEALARQPSRLVPEEVEEPAPVDENQISLFDEQDEPDTEDEEPAEEPSAPAEAEEEPDAEEEELPDPDAEDEEEPEEAPVRAAAESDEDEDEPEEDDEEEEPRKPARLPVQKTLRKPRVLLLILYILIAIPIALVGVIVLLIPALACLAVAAACVVVAVFGVTSAFGSFPKLANLLVALGVALVLLALGLLFLMLFIWFIGGAIGGWIRALIALGGKWCYKEVAAA